MESEGQTIETEIFQSQKSCEFVTTNERNRTLGDEECKTTTRRNKYRIGDEKIPIIVNVQSPKRMGDLISCFKDLKDFHKKPLAKSRFGMASETSRIQSSEYYHASNQSYSRLEDQHSVDANTYSKNGQLTVGTNSEKFTTENGLQSWHYTAHAPIFQTQQIPAKSESDSEVSKGVVETSDDFENMQTNNNFGKFEQTSKFNFEVEMSRHQMNDSA